MLETLVSLVNFLKTTSYYVLYWSYKIGHTLVSILNTLFSCLTALVGSSLGFLSVLYESLSIFVQDNLHFLQQLLAMLAATFDTVYTSVTTVLHKITTVIYGTLRLTISTQNAITNVILAIFYAIGQLILLAKKLIILFGSGVWFLITLVPLLLYYSLVLSVSFVQRLCHEILDLIATGVSSVKTFVKDIILFVVDVPWESLAGLIIGLCLTYLFVQFYMIIKTFFKRKLRELKLWFRRARRLAVQQPNAAPPPGGRRSLRIQAQQPTRMAKTPNKSMLNEDNHCVICQEKIKCILLLPCRHLCLCEDCNRELRYYNEECPICRTNIDRVMKIYV